MSLYICYNGNFVNGGDHSKGCHLGIKKFHPQADGRLAEVKHVDVNIPNPALHSSTKTPSITWTENSERGRLVLSSVHNYSVLIYKLHTDLSIGAIEVLSSKVAGTSRANNIMWRNKLANIAMGDNDIFIAQNIPDPRHPDWQGWQALTVREGPPGISSSRVPFIVDVPNGAGYVYVLYTNDKDSWQRMNIAVLDNELYEQAQTNITTYWLKYHFKDIYTTDGFTAVVNENVMHAIYRGGSGQIFHFWVEIDEFGLPKYKSKEGDTYMIETRDQQELPHPGEVAYRVPTCTIVGNYIYAVWELHPSNGVTYSYAKLDATRLTWKAGSNLGISIHEEADLWGLSVTSSPQA